MAGRVGAGRPLAVDADPRVAAVHRQGLELGDVVADVVHHLELDAAGRRPQRLGEALPRPVGHHLAVGEGVVGGRRHRRQVAPPLRRADRRAAELAVGQLDAVLPRRLDHHLQVVGAHLVAEAARAAVDHHHHLLGEEPEGAGGGAVVDLGDDLDLAEVVARAQRAELAPAALVGALGDRVGVGAGDRSPLLQGVEVAALAEPVLHRPAGARASTPARSRRESWRSRRPAPMPVGTLR